MAKTNFYTPNGWAGKNYNPRIKGKDVAKLLREYIKENDDLNACKWSVRVSDCGYTSDRLSVALMSAPFDPFGEEWKQAHPGYYEAGYCDNAAVADWVTPQCFKLIEKVKAFVTSYICDDSDSMIDYFDRNIYDRYTVGKFDKPFQTCEPKKAKSKPAKAAAKPAAEPAAKATGLQIVDYSAKALAVVGNTKEFKDALKKLGGKFNSRLSCGAGWIFSKKREPELRALIDG